MTQYAGSTAAEAAYSTQQVSREQAKATADRMPPKKKGKDDKKKGAKEGELSPE